jgi:hypothetical protein
LIDVHVIPVAYCPIGRPGAVARPANVMSQETYNPPHDLSKDELLQRLSDKY